MNGFQTFNFILKQSSVLGKIGQSQLRCFHLASGPLLIRSTQPLLGEPLKKKKKVDPSLILEKEAKKKKKIEKEIKKLEMIGRILKPIDEIECRDIIKTMKTRLRQPTMLSEEEEDRRANLFKSWQKFKFVQFVREGRAIDQQLASRNEALDELRKESEHLYQLAIQLDNNLPFKRTGPVETPPIMGYAPPDGDYIDTTKVFDK